MTVAVSTPLGTNNPTIRLIDKVSTGRPVNRSAFRALDTEERLGVTEVNTGGNHAARRILAISCTR